MCLVQTGRAPEGLALMARSVQRLAGQARFRHNYGLMLAQAGDLVAAERELAAAAREEPANASIFQYLGMVRQMLGRASGAADAYRAACALAPQNAQLANSLGSALNESGDARGAAESYRRAVELEPRYALAWHNLALALRDLGDEAGAFEALRGAIGADAQFAPAWQQFAQSLERTRFEAWDAQAERDLEQALARSDIDPQPLAEAAASLFLLDPAAAPAVAALTRGEGAEWTSPERLAPLARPLLLTLLEQTLVPDPAFEAFARGLRSALLDAWRRGAPHPSPAFAALACALAQNCFLNEYVWPESPPESAALPALEAEARAGKDPLVTVLLACFRPLRLVPGLRRPPGANDALARLWRRQMDEPAEEQRLRAGLGGLTPISDAISLAVQRQYEENPYPRWHRLPASFASAYPVRQAIRALFPHEPPDAFDLPETPDILIAGCGTGFQTAVTGRRNPGARIMAVDLSATSLAYAARSARELNVSNVEFAQADLLQLGGMGRRFHVIECAGVLHHLRDPLEGWRMLRSLLAPRGVMKVALYSEIARRGVVQARALAARHGLGTDLAAVREIRRLVLAEPDGSAARDLTLSSDFYSASGARDLMLHVQEHRYTTAAIAAALQAVDLRFVGFELADPAILAAYRSRFPDDPQAVSLERWGRFEAERPHIFAGMYQFWAVSPA
jgi:2-polyprenyl-3-methyl-5-hydroxy-6-metoxy-1,4-benzoquinol methylase/tetratricopeptide (TPR) repeat protein